MLPNLELHGLEDSSTVRTTRYIALGYDHPTLGESGVAVGNKEYYSRFPEAFIEYYDETYDLADLQIRYAEVVRDERNGSFGF